MTLIIQHPKHNTQLLLFNATELELYDTYIIARFPGNKIYQIHKSLDWCIDNSQYDKTGNCIVELEYEEVR